ncbi:MAG TPA: hypothetical protein VHM88_09795 [Candidatus Acidoferrales bacterium]|nr:hypothetical protein [Candidatus Acidoferrales bacterium]
MPDTGRMFLCARCRAQVVICRKCDRGQIYCTRACSKQARCASLRTAGRRYQASRPGRFTHAQRARRYRTRQKNVTHQGSVRPPADALLPAVATEPAVKRQSDAAAAATAAPRCHRCGACCAPAVRLGFVRRGPRGRNWTKTIPDEHSPGA